MTRVSPHQQAASEHRLRNLTTVLYVAVVGGVICVAYLLLGPPQTPDLPPTTDPVGRSTSHSDETAPATETQVSDASLTNSVLALQDKLCTNSTHEISTLTDQLSVLADRLGTTKLTTSELAQVESRIAHLQEQINDYQAQSQRPVVNIDSLLSTINSIAERLSEDDERDTATAIATAEQEMRTRFEADVRDDRLKVRDSQDQIARLQQQIAHEQRDQTLQREKAKREKALAADMQDVRKHLRPFITPGYLQPKAGSNPWNTERTVDAQPVSLSRLKQAGALDRTIKGLERLYIFGGGKNPGLRNSRPLGGFPEYFAEQLHKPQVRGPVERAQELLIQHGQALVEQQLLLP